MTSTRPPRTAASAARALAAALGIAASAAQAQPATPTPMPAPTPAPAAAAASAATLERVEIAADRPSDTEARRRASAARIVVGRDEIERQGDSSVADILKRLPGVTLGGRPGRGGEVRMRGLGSGYTQILINGERAPAGFSLDQLSPDLIERIELLRAPTAETGARAVAGTIDIILREDVKKRLNTVKVALGHQDGGLQPGLSWSRAEQIEPFGYSLSANLSGGRRDSRSQTHTRRLFTPAGSEATALQVDQQALSRSQESRQHGSLGGRLQWRLGPGEQLALQPFAMVSSADTGSLTERSAAPDTLLAAQPYSRSDSEATFALGRLNGQWQSRWGGGLRSELRGGVSQSRWEGDTRQLDGPSADTAQASRSHSRVDDRWWTLGAKLNRSLAGGHALAAGLEAELGRRDQRSDEEGSGAADSLADTLNARTERTALWLQDEWDLDAHWSLHGGLRWEQIATHSDWDLGTVRHRSRVTSPLLHAVWRPVEGGRDQLRASLTRSWRAPSLQNLVARRSISRSTPTDQTNEATRPDRIGNPALRPELATGLDLAYERYLADGGLLSIGLFHRRIADLIRPVTTLQTVDWASAPRWVSQPRNLGNARSSGVELEAKYALKALLGADAPRVDLRHNLALFRSRVDGIPGPDNRLDQQPDWTANLGADWRLRGWPLTLGASLNLTPRTTVLQTSSETGSQASRQDARRVLDAYALWTFVPGAKLRLSAANLLARDFDTESSVLGLDASGRTLTTSDSRERSTTHWRLELEVRL
ncbi:MAG: TonB-dependent receptor [Burkholderiaceae bacterium]|nr:TonB-dependent receptor [Burkholderiaceae bacterium]